MRSLVRAHAVTTSGDPGSAAGAHELPQPAAGDQRRLDHLGVAGGQLRVREGGERLGVGDHRHRLVEGAHVVLGLRQINAGLAAVGGVDLRHQGRGDLHHPHPALVGGRAEPGQIADHSAAERHDDVGARHGGARQLRPHDLGVGDRLGLLAGHDRHPGVKRLQALGIQAPGVVVGDEEAPPVHGPRPERRLAEQARSDVHRVVAAGGRGPQHAPAARAPPAPISAERSWGTTTSASLLVAGSRLEPGAAVVTRGRPGGPSQRSQHGGDLDPGARGEARSRRRRPATDATPCRGHRRSRRARGCSARPRGTRAHRPRRRRRDRSAW